MLVKLEYYLAKMRIVAYWEEIKKPTSKHTGIVGNGIIFESEYLAKQHLSALY